MEKKHDSVIATALGAWAESGKQSSVKLSGNSMRPLLKNGSTVVVEHGSDGICFGDIIVFRREGTLVVHRVVRVCRRSGKRLFVTKGDRALKFDPSLLREHDVLGRVVGVAKGEKTVTFQARCWSVVNLLLAIFSLAVGSMRALIERR